jgi:hypothetical protein
VPEKHQRIGRFLDLNDPARRLFAQRDVDGVHGRTSHAACGLTFVVIVHDADYDGER